MNIKYDEIADAMYMKVNSGKIAKTLKLEDRLIVDVDGKNNILGIEILQASTQKGLLKGLKANLSGGIPVAMSRATPLAA